jgi:LacI family repressor for deo operon, udp, cdd, tsx, nupC, and nupG
VTIGDVARRAGVSTATVSRTLSAPDRVAAPTREAVMAAVRATGYRVNRAARNLRLQRSGVLVVLVPNLGNPFFSEILQGIEEVATAAGLNVMVMDTRANPPGHEGLVRLMAEGQGDGMICLDGSIPLGDLAAFRQTPHAGRLVFACEWVPYSGFPSIRSDNAEGVRLVMDHLIGLGHRRIAHVKGPAGNVLSSTRAAAYRAALEAARLPVREAWVLPGEFDLASGQSAARALLEMQDRPTAVVCASDQMAVGMIGEFARRGLRVPQDISVAGFDDISIAGYVWPGLTTVRQERRALGRRAAERLLARLNGPPAERTAEDAPEIVPVSLVLRGTTGPCPPA